MTPKQLVSYVVAHLSAQTFAVPVNVVGNNFVLRTTLSETEITVSVRPQSFSAETQGRSGLKYDRGIAIGVMQKAVTDGNGSYDDDAVNDFIEVVEDIATKASKTPEPCFSSMEVADYLDAFELEEGYFATQITIEFQEL